MPADLPIHRAAAQVLWAPMLAMGVSLVAAGFVLSLVAAGKVGDDAELARQQSAWVQRSQFLGAALVLGGISFLLGTILGALEHQPDPRQLEEERLIRRGFGAVEVDDAEGLAALVP